MAHQQLRIITKHIGAQAFALTPIRLISTSHTNSVNQRWREERGLPSNPTSHGVLTDSPDYSFLDGRPTPYGVRQKRRLVKQRVIAEQIITLTKEVDFAVERHKQMQIEEEQRKRQILDNKLKPKGLLLLKKGK